ncbi:MAG: hypothetical protein GVY36_14110 [Verrucomicrobia bacterium]|nr:hypothetical protein [Verrucomicrobiota bacterium]
MSVNLVAQAPVDVRNFSISFEISEGGGAFAESGSFLLRVFPNAAYSVQGFGPVADSNGIVEVRHSIQNSLGLDVFDSDVGLLRGLLEFDSLLSGNFEFSKPGFGYQMGFFTAVESDYAFESFLGPLSIEGFEVFSFRHRTFLYPVELSRNSSYFYDYNLRQWWFSSVEVYPWMYVFGNNRFAEGWYFFFEQSAANNGYRVFSRAADNATVTDQIFR